MRLFRALFLVFLLFSAACAPSRPEVAGTEVPAAPLLRTISERRQSLTSVRALASAQVFRRGTRLGLDSVGILLRSDGRFRIEAYTPLGQPLVQVVWDGQTTVLVQDGKQRAVPGRAALERYLGADSDPGELWALLTGNLSESNAVGEAIARCTSEECVLELRQNGLSRSIRLRAGSEGAADVLPVSYELSRSGHVLLSVRYDDYASVSGYLLPRSVVIENPDRRSGIALRYEEQEVNVPLDDSAFSVEGTAW